MNDRDLYKAIGDIDEKFIADAGATRGQKTVRTVTFAPWLKWAAPSGSPKIRRFFGVGVAACLVIATAIAVPTMLNNLPAEDSGRQSTAAGAFGAPSLTIGDSENSEACYAEPADWRGLPVSDYVLQEKGVAADRKAFTSLQDLADSADAWAVVPNVHETSADGENMQTSIAEYAETIGDVLSTRQWDDYTISAGSRILIRQILIGGCTMDEPNNLLRKGGVYLLPVKLNTHYGAYEVVGDLDVLFELNEEGKIVSHSRYPDLNQYDGESFTRLLEAVRALYPTADVQFIEQPINTIEEAQSQIEIGYICSGFFRFSAEFEKEAVIKGVDVFLFKVTFGQDGANGMEYAWVAKRNGAFQHGSLDADGNVIGGLGGLGNFPKDSR